MKNSFFNATPIVYHLFIGFVWLGVGIHFLIELFVKENKSRLYTEYRSLILPFAFLVLLYGIWRLYRGYMAYKKK